MPIAALSTSVSTCPSYDLNPRVLYFITFVKQFCVSRKKLALFGQLGVLISSVLGANEVNQIHLLVTEPSSSRIRYCMNCQNQNSFSVFSLPSMTLWSCWMEAALFPKTNGRSVTRMQDTGTKPECTKKNPGEEPDTHAQ